MVPHPVCCAVLLLSLIVGCHKSSPADRRQALVGTWQMVLGHDCQDYHIKSDTLNLNADGTFIQVVVADDGRTCRSGVEHWTYRYPSSIEFNRRRDFLVSQTSRDLVGTPEFEILVVQYSSPPVIVLNPHTDCAYAKSR